MRKKITICGKEYEICSSAFTMFLYKKEFKTGMMADINRLQEMAVKQQEIEATGVQGEELEKELGLKLMPDLDNYIEVAFRIAYVLIKCGNPTFMPFDKWLETIEEFKIEDSWVAEVTEIAVNSFCGQGIDRPSEVIENKKQ